LKDQRYIVERGEEEGGPPEADRCKAAPTFGNSERQSREKKQQRGAMRNRITPRCLGWPGECVRPRNGEGTHPDAYSGDDVQRTPKETVGL
jgi:hypothetical protein